jgi:hypothetical protein
VRGVTRCGNPSRHGLVPPRARADSRPTAPRRACCRLASPGEPPPNLILGLPYCSASILPSF